MSLEKNVGPRDAQIRTVLAAVIIVVALLLQNPWVKIVLALLAAALAATGYLHTCFLYKFLGKNTSETTPAPTADQTPSPQEGEHKETGSAGSEKTS